VSERGAAAAAPRLGRVLRQRHVRARDAVLGDTQRGDLGDVRAYLRPLVVNAVMEGQVGADVGLALQHPGLQIEQRDVAQPNVLEGSVEGLDTEQPLHGLQHLGLDRLATHATAFGASVAWPR
jgi:hypothetical protein